MKELFNIIESKLKRFHPHAICHYDKDKAEFNLYFPNNGRDMKSYLEEIDEFSKNLIIFIQKSYYYQIISLKKEIKDIATIRRICVSKIIKSNKNSHLQIVNKLKDLYV